MLEFCQLFVIFSLWPWYVNVNRFAYKFPFIRMKTETNTMQMSLQSKKGTLDLVKRNKN